MVSPHESLRELIAERCRAGADVAAIDARIRARFEETWTVVFTDLVGFSRRTEEFGILHFLGVIHRADTLLGPLITGGGGRIVKQEADSWLILFREPGPALDVMQACQEACAADSQGRAEEDRIELCVGMGHGPILRVGDDEVWGREVNVASRLGEDTARGGEIIVSDAFRAALTPDRRRVRFVRLDLPRFPGPCWRVLAATSTSARPDGTEARGSETPG